MRTHLRHAVVGGGVVPVILAAAAAIGNASQQALDLNLRGTALAIYVLGFVAAAAIVTAISLRLEGQKAIAALGSPEGLEAIAELAKAFGLGDLFGGPPTSAPTSGPPFTPSPTSSTPPPPRPPEPRP